MKSPRSIESIYTDILRLSPQVVSYFYPSNMRKQRELFLSGTIQQPNHHYDKLIKLNIDAATAELAELRIEIEESARIKQGYRQLYLDSIDVMVAKYQLMQAARLFKTAEDRIGREAAAAQFEMLNQAVYGAPEPSVYYNFIERIRGEWRAEELPAAFGDIYQELMQLLPESRKSMNVPFQPRPEAFRALCEYAQDRYHRLLQHVPIREGKFTADEVAAVFASILRQEFPEATSWRVVLAEAASIKVVTVEKKIVVPHDRPSVSAEKLRELVAHEIGMHFLRAIAGEATDLPLMSLGLPQSYLFEEGAGKVAEQLVSGVYKERVSPVYLAAGLAGEGWSFRAIYELLWRYELLQSSQRQESNESYSSEEYIARAQQFGYMTTLRIFRGTDALPWFKDIAYYKGTQAAWLYFDSCVDEDGNIDQVRLERAFLGKIDPQNPLHCRVALEAHESWSGRKGQGLTRKVSIGAQSGRTSNNGA